MRITIFITSVALLLGFADRVPAMSLTESTVLLRNKMALQANSIQKPAPTTTVCYPWKRKILATVFWIGEQPTTNNPVTNSKSSWDASWRDNYGGVDCPNQRRGYLPVGFVPQQNPFYVALPYNDVTMGRTKPEAAKVIPWYKSDFTEPGKSICKGRWIAIHYKGRICFAQWEDCGPFLTDHWQYVFGNERPKPNLNGGAGIDISPAVRDFLGMTGNDKVDWKFVDIGSVSQGPWRRYGENNEFAMKQAEESRAMMQTARVALNDEKQIRRQ